MKPPCPICGDPWPHETTEALEACNAKLKTWKPTGILKGVRNVSLCPEFEERAAMTDDEFWSHVFAYREGTEPEFDPPEVSGDELIEPDDECPECGAVGACGYDSEGRPMIHAIGVGDDES